MEGDDGKRRNRAEKNADRNRIADLQTQLRHLLNRWDPIGVADLVDDEYDCMLGPVLTRLARGDDAAALGEYLWFEVKDHFGLDPERSRPDVLAEQLVAWFAATKA